MYQQSSRIHHLVIFFISFWCIVLELILTRVLILKAWNHVVYIVIPFAILGYGIGANLYLLLKQKLHQYRPNHLLAGLLGLLAGFSLVSTLIIIVLPMRVAYLEQIFMNIKAVCILLTAYSVFLFPFVIIGFTVVYLFSLFPHDNPRLYFFDLLGAGIGACGFFFLITQFEILHSLLLLSGIGFTLIPWFVCSRRKYVFTALCLFAFVGIFLVVPEPLDYTIDPQKGWEWIPGYFAPSQYEHVLTQWHPLGRTDAYRLFGKEFNAIMTENAGTFELNVLPLPEVTYFATNFLAGSPVYKLNSEGLAANHSVITPFSVGMEVPYSILQHPRVVIIGTGGGRDIFMAHTHNAQEVIGAEINPAIFQAMSPGGKLYEYSGNVYTAKNTQVYNVDGRHLVKVLPENTVDLIVLNGVDTFAGLSSGAYAYAESYLYTKNAVIDYVRVLKENGIVNFNRWLFVDMPRETLRLEAIILEALQSLGVKNPTEHLIIGGYGISRYSGLSLNLVKKTPFTDQERAAIFNYFATHKILRVYPLSDWNSVNPPLRMFQKYADEFLAGTSRQWAEQYPFDISVVTDDNPFFYKYYKLLSFNPFKPFALHHTGPIVFMTQALILVQALLFIGIFIFLPLLLFKKSDIKRLPSKSAFVIFFSCLGVGFMFIEIPLMQRFVLLLGSPIHSISVVLSVLLISAGIGSGCLPRLRRLTSSMSVILRIAAMSVMVYLVILTSVGTAIYDYFMPLSFFWRVLLVGVILLPLGGLLGIFFPSGLQLVSAKYPDAVAWAWGINCGCSVLGSILAIILAQFLGFNAILLSAAVIYLLGLLSFMRLEKKA